MALLGRTHLLRQAGRVASLGPGREDSSECLALLEALIADESLNQ